MAYFVDSKGVEPSIIKRYSTRPLPGSVTIRVLLICVYSLAHCMRCVKLCVGFLYQESPWQGSNPHSRGRNPMLYPLSYKGMCFRSCVRWARFELATREYLRTTSSRGCPTSVTRFPTISSRHSFYVRFTCVRTVPATTPHETFFVLPDPNPR